MINLFLQKAADVEIKIYSAEGKILKEYGAEPFPQGENNVSLRVADLKLNRGVYLMSVIFSGATLTERFILTR